MLSYQFSAISPELQGEMDKREKDKTYTPLSVALYPLTRLSSYPFLFFLDPLYCWGPYFLSIN
jgi:hypothetical protein